MKIERILAGWEGYQIKVVTDEDLEDMKWAIIVRDHGDEFLYVYMNDGRKYKYGMFSNLKDYESKVKPTLCKEPVIFEDTLTGIAGKKDVTEDLGFSYDFIVRLFNVKTEDLDIEMDDYPDEYGYFSAWINFEWDKVHLANKIFHETFKSLPSGLYMLEGCTHVSKDGTAYYLMQWIDDELDRPHAGYYTLDVVKVVLSLYHSR